MPQRLLLGLVDSLAALPGHGLDQFLDFPLDAGAKIVWIHRVQFPATISVIGAKPLIARISLLIRCRERWQAADLLGCQRDAGEDDVIAAVLVEPRRKIDGRHVHAAWVVVADVEHDQIATVIILGNVMGCGGAAESMHRKEANSILIQHRFEHAAPSLSRTRPGLDEAAGSRNRGGRCWPPASHSRRGYPMSAPAPGTA